MAPRPLHDSQRGDVLDANWFLLAAAEPGSEIQAPVAVVTLGGLTSSTFLIS